MHARTLPLGPHTSHTYVVRTSYIVYMATCRDALNTVVHGVSSWVLYYILWTLYVIEIPVYAYISDIFL